MMACQLEEMEGIIDAFSFIGSVYININVTREGIILHPDSTRSSVNIVFNRRINNGVQSKTQTDNISFHFKQ